jgi:hypothetical protein
MSPPPLLKAMLTTNEVPLVSLRHHKRRISKHGNQRNCASREHGVTGGDIPDQVYNCEALNINGRMWGSGAVLVLATCDLAAWEAFVGIRNGAYWSQGILSGGSYNDIVTARQ